MTCSGPAPAVMSPPARPADAATGQPRGQPLGQPGRRRRRGM